MRNITPSQGHHRALGMSEIPLWSLSISEMSPSGSQHRVRTEAWMGPPQGKRAPRVSQSWTRPSRRAHASFISGDRFFFEKMEGKNPISTATLL